MPPPLTILWRDARFVAVAKPAGLLMHRSPIAERVEDFLMQRLRDQLRRHVYLIHRLDRPTSGVVLFALDPEAARAACAHWEERTVEKSYLAVVRGWPAETGTIDYALAEEPGKPLQPAITHWRRLATAEIPVPVGRYAQARCALLEVRPETGRLHQIRKHFHHVSHHLIGDTTHGDGRHNRLFRERFGCRRLLLHAWRLTLPHPLDGTPLELIAPPDAELAQLFDALGGSPGNGPGAGLRQDQGLAGWQASIPYGCV